MDCQHEFSDFDFRCVKCGVDEKHLSNGLVRGAQWTPAQMSDLERCAREALTPNRLEPLAPTPAQVMEGVNTLLTAAIDPLLRRIEALECRLENADAVLRDLVRERWRDGVTVEAKSQAPDIAQAIRDVSAGR